MIRTNNDTAIITQIIIINFFWKRKETKQNIRISKLYIRVKYNYMNMINNLTLLEIRC